MPDQPNADYVLDALRAIATMSLTDLGLDDRDIEAIRSGDADYRLIDAMRLKARKTLERIEWDAQHRR